MCCIYQFVFFFRSTELKKALQKCIISFLSLTTFVSKLLDMIEALWPSDLFKEFSTDYSQLLPRVSRILSFSY